MWHAKRLFRIFSALGKWQYSSNGKTKVQSLTQLFSIQQLRPEQNSFVGSTKVSAPSALSKIVGLIALWRLGIQITASHCQAQLVMIWKTSLPECGSGLQKCYRWVTDLETFSVLISIKEYKGTLNYATDCWTSPNHWAYMAIMVHFLYNRIPISILLDIVEVTIVCTCNKIIQVDDEASLMH